jgi:site-specific DNA-methyltransferase (adenine-specific)
MTWDLRCGRWQDTLAGVKCDALICDPPYGAKTHKGHNNGVDTARLEGEEKRMRIDKRTGAVYSVGISRRRTIDYSHWSAEDVAEFVTAWAPRVRGWFVAMTSHDLIGAWQNAYESAGLYAFAPVAWVSPGGTVRLGGDGPANWTCYVMVARPRSREWQRWGALPGAYVIGRGQGNHIGGKPAALMRALIRDYTRPGDLVCDPCAGGGTTLLAAVQEGRRAVGSEMDPETHAKAVERLERKLAQSDLWAACERVKAAEQTDLL